MRHFLYATDGSEGALAAGRFLAGLSRSHETHVHILIALASDDPDDGGGRLSVAREALGAFPNHITMAAVRAASTGAVAEAILKTAEDINADLIVVGSNGHSAIARFLLGSVSEAVVQHAACPVLVARAASAPLREVIVGVDGSDDARYAAGQAILAFPLPPTCAVRLVRVVSEPSAPTVIPGVGIAGAYSEVTQEMIEAEKEAAQKYVDRLRDDLRTVQPEGGGTPQLEGEVGIGNAASALIDIAHEREAGLIVVALRGMSGFARFLLGSVSKRVVRHAPCSVFVVKRPEGTGGRGHGSIKKD